MNHQEPHAGMSEPPSAPGASRLTPAELAARIDHTLLRPQASPADIDRLCDEGLAYGFAAVCVNPCYAARAARRLAGRRPAVCTVVGFPLGANASRVKSCEAAQALDDGASELDMVLPLGAALAGDLDAVCRDVQAVLAARDRLNPRALVKVILETAVLPADTIIALCGRLSDLGADFLKTSTGFHPAGGATVAHVRLLAAHRGRCRVKAAGGIRNLAAALALLAAGADRLGASASLAILDQARTPS